MKKIILLLCIIFLITGCTKNNKEDIMNKFVNKVNNCDSYFLKADLELRNNDDVYNYYVEVSYEKKSNYKVSLTNKSNGSTQIIVKNKDGVYILTPSLNRSFKFQSDWPYNNSQIYLLKSLVNDIKGDKELTISRKNKDYIIKTIVNYPNNKELVSQKIILNKNGNLKKVTVYDTNNIPSIILNIKKIDYSPSFDKNYFELNYIMEKATLDVDDSLEDTATLEDTIYPLLLPTNTSLANEERIKTTDGERILMTFEGDNPFLLVEETVSKENDFTVIPTNGVPFQLMDVLGVKTDNSLSWISNGIEYYLVSDVLNSSELINIAQSIYVLPTSK
ncbi:MAG: outer membrane lipoprotein carrier protein LolA [Bacilli bacterium]|nr:outer membrane lipoprotein carrier protein LolA [Bacilli bacterium]